MTATKKFRYLFGKGDYTLIFTKEDATSTTVYTLYSEGGEWKTAIRENAFATPSGGAKERTYNRLPFEVQQKWVNFLQENGVLQDIYTIGSISNTSFICDLQEGDFCDFVTKGFIKILADSDAIEGNCANYIVTDSKFIPMLIEKSLTTFLKS